MSHRDPFIRSPGAIQGLAAWGPIPLSIPEEKSTTMYRSFQVERFLSISHTIRSKVYNRVWPQWSTGPLSIPEERSMIMY